MNKRSFIAAALVAFAFAAPARAEVRRVVSLNPCLDVILVNVADREQIAALSHFSRDTSSSTIAELSKSFPITYESAEEVLSFAPDLVLTSRHSSLGTRNALRRVEIKTELFSEPKSIEESLAHVRRIAELVGHAERGEELITRIQIALKDAAPAPTAAPVPALIYQRNGFSTGGGTLVDEMLHTAGFDNVASRYGLSGWGNISLELVVANPPRIILAGEDVPGMPTWADRVLRHPALRNIEGRMKRFTFPDRLIYCGGPVLIEAARALVAARRQAEEMTP